MSRCGSLEVMDSRTSSLLNSKNSSFPKRSRQPSIRLKFLTPSDRPPIATCRQKASSDMDL